MVAFGMPAAEATELERPIYEAYEQTKLDPRTLLLKGGAKIILHTPLGVLIVEADSIRVTHEVTAADETNEASINYLEAHNDVRVTLGNKVTAQGDHLKYDVSKKQIRVDHRATVWQEPRKAEALTIDVTTGKTTLLEPR